MIRFPKIRFNLLRAFSLSMLSFIVTKEELTPEELHQYYLENSPYKETKNLFVFKKIIYLGDEISVEVELENIGERTSTEVVMLFSQDVVASITPSVDKLKAYQRVSLEPGEVKNVTLRVSSNDLGFINQNLNYVVEPGLFNLRVKDKYASISIIN